MICSLLTKGGLFLNEFQRTNSDRIDNHTSHVVGIKMIVVIFHYLEIQRLWKAKMHIWRIQTNKNKTHLTFGFRLMPILLYNIYCFIKVQHVSDFVGMCLILVPSCYLGKTQHTLGKLKPLNQNPNITMAFSAFLPFYRY